ncbi:MAG: hypothetical protein KAS93_02375 [Gammaproteobacteria bacterium]|nr:hypothetical protein [Gammaproteobacteria bacterium]
MPKKQQDKRIELRNLIELEEIDEIDSDYVAYEDLEESQSIDFQKGPSLDIKNTNNVVFSKRVERYFRSMRLELNALGLNFILLSSKKAPKNGLLSAYHRQIDVMGEESVEDGHVLDDETALPEGRDACNRTPLLSDMQKAIELEVFEELSTESSSVNNEVEDKIESSNNSVLLDVLNVESGVTPSSKKNDASLLICADQINFAELDRILRIKPHSRFIRWLLTDNIARKALVFMFTHRWSRNIAVPTKHFRHAKAAGAFSHTDKLVKYVWDALLVSFFIQDFIDYYAYPDYRNERGLFETLFSSRGNKQLLAESLYNPYVLSILLGAPLAVGLMHSTYDYFRMLQK